MKLGQGIVIDWGHIGAELAICESEEQIKFFKGFYREVNSWPTHRQKEMQMLWIADGLSKEEKEILSGIVYEKEEMK